MNRQKIFEILLTACLSALIAVLQGILAHYSNNTTVVADPAIAMGVGGTLAIFRNIKSV